MNIAIISYSYTGNNKALAHSVATELKAEHIQISEHKPRTMRSIILDIIFGRIPQVDQAPEIINNYDMIIFFAPVWMGLIASPLRPYLKYLREHPQKYGFMSVSGGADGSNQKLVGELNKRIGADPVVFMDLHIADLFPSNSKPIRKETSSYHLKDKDIKQFTRVATSTINVYLSKQLY